MSDDPFCCAAEAHILFRKSAEPQFETIAENMGGGFICYDAQWRFVFINAEAERLLGVQRGETLGRIVWEVFPSLPGTRLEQEYRRAAAGELRDFEDLHEPWGRFLHNRCFPCKGDGIFHCFHDITERKRTEKEWEQYFRLFNTSFDLMIIAEPNGRIRKINPAGLKILGYSETEMLNRPYVAFIHPDDRKRTLDEASRMLLCGNTLHFENRYLCKDGTCRWLTWRALYDKDDGLAYAAAQDITDRKRAEEEIMRAHRDVAFANATLNAVIESMSDWVWEIDGDNRYTYCSSEVETCLGYTPAEIIGRTPFDLMPPDEAERIRMKFAEICQRKAGFRNLENTNIAKDGRHVFLSTSGVPILDAAGNLTGYRGIEKDLTELKQTEEELRKAEAYARNLIEVNLDPLVTIAPDGRISDVNKASMLATGCSREEMIGTDFSSYFTDPEEARAGYRHVFDQGMIRDYPLEICHRDGHVTPVLYNAIVYLNESGQVAGVFAAARDITQLKQAEEELLTMNNELERRVEQRTLELQETQKQFLHVGKLSAIGKLSASIAHEFNNPLQGILSILNGLKKRAIMETEDRELLDAAIAESARIKNLIRSLQEFHRPSAGLKMVVDVHASLDAILLLHKNDFREKQITVNRHYAENVSSIVAVPDQIKQVFLNLLINAADACQYPGEMITVSTRQEGDNVAVAIKDTGIGIKPEEMEQIFQPFYTTKPAVKGTGLGLSVSYGIVKNHNGEIRVESRPGEGTTFTVLLPIKNVGSALAAAEE